MEIKAYLEKPITENQRMEFIVEYNHKQGYEIRETEEQLQAWGLTEQEIADKEHERIMKLSCTKRDFVNLLQDYGVNYRQQILPMIQANEQALNEWELCERLYRFNPLLDVMAGQLGITSEQLDMIFKMANGENEAPIEEEPTEEIEE